MNTVNDDAIHKRLVGIGALYFVAIIFIVGRLAYLQIYCAAMLEQQGTKNFLRFEKTRPLRGSITDCHGDPLVTNRPVAHVVWQPTGNTRLTKQQYQVLHELESILGLSLTGDVTLIKTIERAERRGTSVTLARDISFDQMSKIAERCCMHPNITIKWHDERFYPYGSVACHAIGYLGGSFDVSLSGKMGLEKKLDEILKGNDGQLCKTVNAMGVAIDNTHVELPRAGPDVKTTLNSDIQRMCENIFPLERTGTIIVMQPDDGSITALVSRPSFEPALFLKHIDQQVWQDLEKNHAFLNRALGACYPPGSIFKLVTVSAALEQGIITPDYELVCKGFTLCGSRPSWCHNRLGHGKISCVQAVAQSCNVLFYEIGKQIDVDTLARYADMFGLGKKTGIILPEREGIVPSRTWKQQTYGEKWWQGETLSVTIGQSFLLVTPMQVARMIGSIFTGYLAKPRILIDEPVEKEPLFIAESTRDLLKKSMKKVVKRGTGKRIRSIKDIEIYAKTSTAQTSAWYKRKMGPEFLEHGWFVAYLQYKDMKPLVLVILIEHVGSSSLATNVARDFLVQYKKLVDAWGAES